MAVTERIELPADAERAVRREFGNIGVVKDVMAGKRGLTESCEAALHLPPSSAWYYFGFL
jgi:hypothetical protein